LYVGIWIAVVTTGVLAFVGDRDPVIGTGILAQAPSDSIDAARR
jgi:hypothetical protein